jgi:hypothetical protein
MNLKGSWVALTTWSNGLGAPPLQPYRKTKEDPFLKTLCLLKIIKFKPTMGEFKINKLVKSLIIRAYSTFTIYYSLYVDNNIKMDLR